MRGKPLGYNPEGIASVILKSLALFLGSIGILLGLAFFMVKVVLVAAR